MSNPTGNPAPPPGWYPDPAGPPSSRWWDGAQWTNHVHDPREAEAAAAAAQPETTQPAAAAYAPTAAPYVTPQPYAAVDRPAVNTALPPYTPWIWVMLALVALPIIALAFFDFDSYMRAAVGTSSGDFTGPTSPLAMFTPSYFALLGLGWVTYALTVLFAYFDWRQTRQSGLVRPFHWAWAFLSGGVYIIGRSVIARRRTGRGIAPMWIWIALEVIALIVAFSKSISAISNLMSTYPGTGI